jgi:ubiquinone/menaquinone biosynthesis C-methylase UbiE
MKQYPELYDYLANLTAKYISFSNPLILDLGVGPGLLSSALYKQVPQSTIIGLDTSDTMLSFAQQQLHNMSCTILLKASSENIPLSDTCVDVVVSRFGLPYWTNPQQSIEEIYRIIKQGGTVIFEALNRVFPQWKLLLIKLHMYYKKAGKEVIRYHLDAYSTAFTMPELEQLLTKAGFTVLETRGTSKEWKFIIVATKSSQRI